jgi:conjugative transfer signal peptidase TraF
MVEGEKRAILRIGDALRHDKARRSRLTRRGAAVVMLGGALALTIALPVRPLLVWNTSASAPVGLYAISAPNEPRIGDMVIARLAPQWRALAAARRYVPATVPVVKRVAATPGDTVCALGRGIFIEGRRQAERRLADARRRLMPWWQGCITLRDGAVLLLNSDPASFDGRYFGPTRPDDLIGRARLLWPR